MGHDHLISSYHVYHAMIRTQICLSLESIFSHSNSGACVLVYLNRTAIVREMLGHRVRYGFT